jgi:hypothetical protein
MRENRKEKFVMALRSSRDIISRILDNDDVDSETKMIELKDTKRKLETSMKLLEEVKKDGVSRDSFWGMLGWAFQKWEN